MRARALMAEHRSELALCFSHLIFLFSLCCLQQTAVPAISVLDLVCSYFFPLVLFPVLIFLFSFSGGGFMFLVDPVLRGGLEQDA